MERRPLPSASLAIPQEKPPQETNHRGYFRDSTVEFFSSGCSLLDCALGGGYPRGRIVNIVGDKSTGKTLLVIEAAINFLNAYPKAKVAYREAESAFSKEYAEVQLGLPVGKLDWKEDEESIQTVEDFFEDLEGVDKKKGFLDSVGAEGGLYILDSLDSLSDRAEMAMKIDDASYHLAKARKLSEAFRRLVQRIKNSNVTVIIISQIRENIGVTFGKKYSRSGGKALDFYASQVLYLAQKGVNTKTIKGVERPIGVQIRAKLDKNKVGLPLRQAEFDIVFGFGIDDMAASLNWMQSVRHFPPKVTDLIGLVNSDKDVIRVLADINKLAPEDYKIFSDTIKEEIVKHWEQVETGFLPTRKKYT